MRLGDESAISAAFRQFGIARRLGSVRDSASQSLPADRRAQGSVPCILSCPQGILLGFPQSLYRQIFEPCRHRLRPDLAGRSTTRKCLACHPLILRATPVSFEVRSSKEEAPAGSAGLVRCACPRLAGVGQATNLGAAFDQHKSAFLISLISLTYRWQLKKEAPALTGAELGNNMIAGRIASLRRLRALRGAVNAAKRGGPDEISSRCSSRDPWRRRREIQPLRCPRSHPCRPA